MRRDQPGCGHGKITSTTLTRPTTIRPMPPPAPRTVQQKVLRKAQITLLDWYSQHARDLPWRRTKDPYAILVSEVMLQQTQVDRVIPKYDEFLRLFPTFQALAAAPTADVIRAWSPLGYNRRAVRLQAIAAQIAECHGGELPEDMKTLLSLPGVGEYTASALACFIHGQNVPVIDTNVRRVLSRVFRGTASVAPMEVRTIAQWALPLGRGPQWSQALMDIGATLCTSQRPVCPQCPLELYCQAAATFRKHPAVAERRAAYGKRQQPFAGSSRFYRGRIVDCLRRLPAGDSIAVTDLGTTVRDDYEETHSEWLIALVRGLETDGLARVQETSATNASTAVLRISLP